MTETTPQKPPEEPIENLPESPNPALNAVAGAKERLASEKGIWMQAIVLPIALIGVYLVVTGVALNIYGAVSHGPVSPGGLFDSPLALGLTAIVLGAAELFTYRFLVGLFAKRPVHELAWSGAWREILLGIGVGALLVSLPMLILWATGNWRLVTVSVAPGWGLGIAMGLMACVWEELMFRGIMVRIFDLAWGPVWAIVMSTVVFGSLHLMNPGMTGMGVVALALCGGPLLGAAYLWKRRLWFPIGLHFGWNAMQGSFWGSTISGTGTQQGFLQGVFSGPDWLTGGSVGVEGSFLTAIIALVATALILLQIRHEQTAAESPTDTTATHGRLPD